MVALPIVTTLKRLAPFLIILFGFAVRVHAIDTTIIDGDRANPHGIGLLLAHEIGQGKPSTLLLFSDGASTGLPNPPFINYVWAIVSLFDSSLFSAAALGLMANTLAIALVYITGKRCFNWTVGVIAATLIAGSNWGMYLARGAWHPAHLEITVIAAACLLALGVRDSNGKKLAAGFVFAFITAGSYFAGLIVPVQAAIAAALSGGLRPPLRRAWLAGVGLCVAGVLAFGIAMIATSRLTPMTVSNMGLLQRADAERIVLADDSTLRDPIGNFLRLATNRDYALTWTDPNYQGYAMREPLTQVLALALSGFVVLGLARMAWHWRRPTNRFLLAWAALPLFALLAIAAISRQFEVMLYYLLVTSPVQFLAGGYGLAWPLRRAKPVVTLGACAALAILPAWNASAAAESIYKQAFIAPDFMPLRWSQQLGRLWQRECRAINGSNFWWDLSLIQAPERWRSYGTRFNDISSIWTFPAEGGACALKQQGEPLPNSELLPLNYDDDTIIRTYRALPYAIPPEITTTVNLGWSLLDFSAPLAAASGSTITVQHAWRVDALPNEPFADWYYAPFVKLIAPDGRVVIDVNGAVALPGWQWRMGEVQMSDVHLTLPADLPPGDYTIQSSLFDPNQKKNAVYFAADDPATPILTLEREIKIN